MFKNYLKNKISLTTLHELKSTSKLFLVPSIIRGELKLY